MGNRSIHNIRVVIDRLGWNNLIEDDGFMLSLDLYKSLTFYLKVCLT